MKLPPLKAIRKECLGCSETTTDIKYCSFTECLLHPYRMGKKLKDHPPKIKAMKSIKLYCLGCCCGNRNEVKLCPVTYCILYDYRFGKNPNRKGRGKVGGNADALRRYREKTLNSRHDLGGKTTISSGVRGI